MTLEKIEEILEEVSEGTDFSFKVTLNGSSQLDIYMNGDNPENEDWCESFIINMSNTKEELIERLWTEVDNCYQNFDIEENVYLMLEAKRNGFRGVPDVVDLVHNEEYKEEALEVFADKLRKMF